MTGLVQHIEANMPEYTALLGLLAVAIIANMPKPGAKVSLLTFYTWLYDSLQAFMSARNPKPAETHIQTSQQGPTGTTTQDVTIQGPTPVPPQPDGPAQTK